MVLSAVNQSYWKGSVAAFLPAWGVSQHCWKLEATPDPSTGPLMEEGMTRTSEFKMG